MKGFLKRVWKFRKIQFTRRSASPQSASKKTKAKMKWRKRRRTGGPRRRLKSENASAIAKEGMRAGFIVTAHSTFFISPPSLLPKDRRGERLLGLHFKYSDSDLFASVWRLGKFKWLGRKVVCGRTYSGWSNMILLRSTPLFPWDHQVQLLSVNMIWCVLGRDIRILVDNVKQIYLVLCIWLCSL